MSYKAIIITLSANVFLGVREDTTGTLIQEMITPEGFETETEHIMCDDPEKLTKTLIDICDNHKANLVLTAGGTGISQRDKAPEATLAVIERQVPGIAEAIRVASMAHTPRGMLYRGVSGIRGNTLIINLPGNSKAVKETFGAILPVLAHSVSILADSEK